MVSKTSALAGLLAASGFVVKAAQTFTVPIDFTDAIDVSYYFQDSNNLVSVVPNNEGLQITVDSDNVCDILQSGMIVYSTDGSTSNTLLTWNQYEVFHLMSASGQELSWSDVNVQVCGASSSSSEVSTATSEIFSSGVISTTSSDVLSNGGASIASTSSLPSGSVLSTTVVHADQPVSTGVDTLATTSSNLITSAGTVLSASVVTSVVSGVYTEYTTYCPLSTESSVSTTKTATSGSGSAATWSESILTTTVGGVETVYTTYCPLTSSTTSVNPQGVTTTAIEQSTVLETVVSCASNICYRTAIAKTTAASEQGTAIVATSTPVVFSSIEGTTEATPYNSSISTTSVASNAVYAAASEISGPPTTKTSSILSVSATSTSYVVTSGIPSVLAAPGATVSVSSVFEGGAATFGVSSLLVTMAAVLASLI